MGGRADCTCGAGGGVGVVGATGGAPGGAAAALRRIRDGPLAGQR